MKSIVQTRSFQVLVTVIFLVGFVILGGGLNSKVMAADISGEISLYAGTADLTEVGLQLKREGTKIGKTIYPSQDGNYTIYEVEPGKNYTITATLEGYYDKKTLPFEVTEENITEKDIILQRKEPIITTPRSTTISKGQSGVSIVINLSKKSTLDDRFKEGAATNLSNWVIETNNTGLSPNRIIRSSERKVRIDFVGTAKKTRAISIQAKPKAIKNIENLSSNLLTFSVVEDGYVASSNPKLDTYYTKNLDVDGRMKAIVVIVHGLAEHLGRYNYVTEKLNKAGYGVYRLDNKGHGKTEKTVIDGKAVDGYVENFHEYMDDPNIIVSMAKKEHPNKKVFMLGHSMGGRIAAIYGMKYPNQLDGQIFSGSSVKYQDKFVEYYKNKDKKSPFEGEKATEMIPNKLTSAICRDAAIRAQYAADPLNLNQFANKLLHEYRVGAGAYVKKHVEDYEYPTLILHGGDDRIVSKESSQWFYETIDSTDKTIKIYPNCYHEIMNEKKEKKKVLNDIIDWLDERL